MDRKGFVLLAALVSVSPAYGEMPPLTIEQRASMALVMQESMQEAAKACVQKKDLTSCLSLKISAEIYDELLHGSKAERCLRGEADYEMCQEAVDELMSEEEDY
jgi:hypothetical protein